MSDDDVSNLDIQSEGVTNEHTILKDADISDDQGMMKYGVDLTVDTSKIKLQNREEL